MLTKAKQSKKNRLATAVRLASLGLASTILYSAPALAQEEEEGAAVEEMFITGSRIKRSNLDSTTPIQVITFDDMVSQGRFSVADALRSSTSNSFGSFVPASGSTGQSQATVDLLGLGPERTLVLLDGRRVPGSPSLGGTSVNVNQIPKAMVQSIDILKVGASAVYGSDAIAGVVDIRLKEDFEGLVISVDEAVPDEEGGGSNEFSIATGISSDRGNITFAFEHAEQKPVFDRDRPYTAPSVADTDGDGVFDDTVGVSSYGASIQHPTTGLWEASPQCNSLTENPDIPGFVGEIEPSAESDNRYCGFAYSGVSANQASTNRDSIFINSTYDITENVSFFARAIFTHNKSFGRYAPPAALWAGNVPANSEHNPYDEPVVGRFRWYGIGNRDGRVDDYTQDYLAGLEGTLFENMDYEVYYHHNTTDNKAVGEFYLSNSGLVYNLDQGIDLGSEEGIINMKATTLTQDFTRFDQAYAGTSFELGVLPGGNISHYIGAEAFEIQYRSIVDGQSEAGLIGGSAGNSSERDREIWAVFYETLVPLASQLELEFAVRYDEYSDFGSEVSPKLAFTYRPMEDLLIRTSWNRGFRAPTLQSLSQADSFAADFATDWVTCRANNVPLGDCTEEQYDTTRQANENLDAESSTYINVGVVYNPENFNISLDFFDLEIEDAIRFVPIQDLILGEIIGAENPDPSLLQIDRVTNGPEAPEFRTASINGPGLELQGFNLSMEYLLEMGSAGTISFNSETTYFMEWLQDNFAGGPLQNKAGWELQPQYRTQLTTSWDIGRHSLTWNIDFIPSTSSFETPDTSNLVSGLLVENESNDSFMTHNLTYSFDGGAWGRYRLGARNLTDEAPILNSTGEYSNQYDYLYSAGHIGRLISVGATWEF